MFYCLQMKDGRWHQAHFVFHSLDPTLLPVVDICNLPETNPGSHYHLEIGPVCFLWEFSLSHLCTGVYHPKWCSLSSMEIRAASFSGSSIQKDPASLCQPPIGLQTQRGDAGSLRRRRAVEKTGSSCTNSFSNSKGFFMLLQKDLHMYAILEKKRASCQTISLEHY